MTNQDFLLIWLFDVVLMKGKNRRKERKVVEFVLPNRVSRIWLCVAMRFSEVFNARRKMRKNPHQNIPENL